MKFYYPAVISKLNNGGYHAFFPDLEQCEACGDSLDDVLDHAMEAAFNWISAELEEDEPELPSASDPADLSPGPDRIIRNILVNYRFSDGWEE